MQYVTITNNSKPRMVYHVKAPESWETSKRKGAGVFVGVIDSGIEYTHPDLAANYFDGATFAPGTNSPIDEGSRVTSGGQLFFHGTHIAGIIGAIDNQEGVVGVAPQVFLHSLRVMTPAIVGFPTSQAMAAVEWAMNHDLFIINMSYGGDQFVSAEAQQLDLTWKQNGMINVAAAGNDTNHNMDPSNPNSKQNYPAGYPNVIEISASNEQDNMDTVFSNWGKATDFAAPGVDILSTYTMSKFGGYTKASGTSTSCPHAVGVFCMGMAAWRFSPCSDMYHLSSKKNEVLLAVAQQTANKKGLFAANNNTEQFN